MSPTLRAKVAFITGAASGIGLSLSERLARAGARVILTDRDGPGARRATERLMAAGHQASALALDVTDREAVRAAIDETVSREGRLDLLFNNAGIGVGGETFDHGPEAWDRVLAVNLMGVVNGILAAYPVMVRQRAGHIVNVASVAGLVPLPGQIAYTASKWAVVGLSQVLRAEAAAFGVRVTVACPGKIETPIYETSPILGFDREAVLSLWPKGITPEACADAILRGVAQNQALVVITRHARALWWLERLSPDLTGALRQIYMRRMRRHLLPRNEDV